MYTCHLRKTTQLLILKVIFELGLDSIPFDYLFHNFYIIDAVISIDFIQLLRSPSILRRYYYVDGCALCFVTPYVCINNETLCNMYACTISVSCTLEIEIYYMKLKAKRKFPVSIHNVSTLKYIQ